MNDIKIKQSKQNILQHNFSATQFTSTIKTVTKVSLTLYLLPHCFCAILFLKVVSANTNAVNHFPDQLHGQRCHSILLERPEKTNNYCKNRDLQDDFEQILRQDLWAPYDYE